MYFTCHLTVIIDMCSSKRREELKSSQEVVSVNSDKIIQHCTTRWLSLARALTRTLDQRPALLSTSVVTRMQRRGPVKLGGSWSRWKTSVEAADEVHAWNYSKLHTVQLAVPGIIILTILVYLINILRYNKNIILMCVTKRSDLY